jgi:predicted transcriptional regulator
MGRPQTRAAEFAAEKGISIANASMKFKQLWDQGFLLRRESTSDTGGVEFVYQRIG